VTAAKAASVPAKWPVADNGGADATTLGPGAHDSTNNRAASGGVSATDEMTVVSSASTDPTRGGKEAV